MSKRNSTGSSNTLFNYFTKTPPANKKLKNGGHAENSPKLDSSTIKGEKELKTEKKKRERQSTPSPVVDQYNDSDDNVPIAPSKKRKRIRLSPVDSDDSDAENMDNKLKTPKAKEKVSIEKKLQDSFKYEANQSPKSSKSARKSITNGTPKAAPSKEKPSEDTAVTADEGTWIHCKLDWLKADKIKDAQKRRPDHPEYDPRTVHVPPEFFKAQTPAHRQWWEMKASHFDCVLFFKVGKFYELYHMDAAVGVNELGFTYMKGEFAHSGFPESAYGRMASTLVAKGYKVARVEQTETPDMMQERCRITNKNSKFDKVVRREICQVTLRGTQVCGLQDAGPGEAAAAYLMAIAEEVTFMCVTANKNSKFDKVVRREICQVTLRGTQVCGLQDAGPGEAAAAYLMAIAEEVTFMCVTANKNSKFDKVVRREICQVTLRGTQVCGLQDTGPGDAAAAYLMAIAEEVTFMSVTASKNSKFDKVVRREICQVTLRGTQVCGLQDTGPGDAAAAYLLAIAEEEVNGCSTYGVCFVDTSIGLFHLGQFQDDKHSSRLLTTLAHFPPALVVYDRKTSSLRTSKLVGSHCHSARREPISMWTPESTLKTLAEKYYRTNAEGEWPEGLRAFLHEGDVLGLTPAAHSHLAVRALGGCVSYLSDCLLDIQTLGMAQFSSYAPPDVLNRTLSQEPRVESRWEGGGTMVLDAITLKNLRIVQDDGCLYDRMNYCSTAFGKRLLYQWVCAPSCSIAVIKERQHAVRTLFEDQELSQSARSILATLPDLERLLAKVHALGNLRRSEQHPDARAIFYEEKKYSKRKVLDFISVINGFDAALKLMELFSGVESVLLKRIMQFRPDGKYPDYRDTLKFFKEAFNMKEAEKEGRILPGKGVDQEYDAALEAITEIDGELQDYLKEQEKYFKCRVNYVGSDKKRYQLEVSQSAASRAGPDYQLEGARKGYKRFSTTETKELLARMIAAEEQKTSVLKDINRRIFEKFSFAYSLWEAGVNCVATLDILLAFGEFARQQTGAVCLPEVTYDASRKPYINIVEGRHPCIPIANDFIPNDTRLDGENTLLLLTGPNMGGKSTLMRQVGLLAVLSHLGSYVPAQKCSVSLIDRIFTRLGASDDILSGQSTFLVEMSETAAIVTHASLHSLVLLDELGRGTSTYDGTAIASGVCVELAQRSCRVIFSTHYHSLVRHLAEHPGVLLGHMACMVETDEATADNEDHIPEETITFLYKLSPGACPKSYGFNAARLAGIPKEITRRAHQISKNLEREATCVRAFKDILKLERVGSVRELLAALSI